MSQTTITSFYNSRKRVANDDIASTKNKIPHIDHTVESSFKSDRKNKYNSWDINGNKKTSEILNESKHEVKKSDAVKASASNEKLLKKPQCLEVFAKKISTSNGVKISEVAKSHTVNSARKELSLGDIRKRLAGSSRLAELKASAERISKGIEKLQKQTDKRILKEFKSIDVEVNSSPTKKTLLQQEFLSPEKNGSSVTQRPIISPRKVVVSPIKSPTKVPAYIRHASLATSATSLPLPHHYRFLAEIFRGMETVVSLLYNRNEKITFTKLKPSIQEMLKKNFTEKHLAQIKHLVPDYYTFDIQKTNKPNSTSLNDAYELVISPNIPNGAKVMSPNVLLERRRYFYDILLELVKKHHRAYLSNLDPPMDIPLDKLYRWHPEFELEKVPEVEISKLPEIPKTDKYSTAQDVLAKARELFKCNTKMNRALEKLSQAKSRGLTEEEQKVTGIFDNKSNVGTQTAASLTNTMTILNPALRNLPTALLEKVKAKQAAKALEAMTRSSGHEEKYVIYSRLPDLARTLRNIFVTERKNVLALNIILSKLDTSFKANVSASDLQRDIKTLSDEVPEWVKLYDIRNTTYLKLDKNSDLQKIIAKLESLANKYKD